MNSLFDDNLEKLDDDHTKKSQCGELYFSPTQDTGPGNVHLPVPKNWALIFQSQLARISVPSARISVPSSSYFSPTPDTRSHLPLDLGPSDLPTIRSAFRSPQKPLRKRKFVCEDGYTIEETSATIVVKDSYRERVRQRVLVEKQRQKEVRSRAKRGVRKSGSGKIDFSKLDQRGDPAVSFDPDSPLRDHLLAVIDRSERDPARRKLMAKIGTEFGRIYTRYRRTAERALGKAPSVYGYEIPEREKAYAAEAAMWCIVKGVTPRELLQYWHTHIRTFADKRMKVPPLGLLKAPGIVDQVACASLSDDPVEQGGTEGHSSASSPVPAGKNSFSDERDLDRKLRRGLERAGYDTQDYSDRYLLTVQKIAISIAKGQRIFVANKIKPMAKWAAENLYAVT